MNAALKMVDCAVCDEWLIVAECARLANNASIARKMGEQGAHGHLIEAFAELCECQSASV